jgi:hypothetical protein
MFESGITIITENRTECFAWLYRLEIFIGSFGSASLDSSDERGDTSEDFYFDDSDFYAGSSSESA